VTEYKFLGVVFDSPVLNWGKHVLKLKIDGLKRTNVLKAVAHHQWGADREILLTLYRALVLSKINHGAEFFNTASNTTLATLDVIQNTCLRLAVGARQTSPICSLEVETNFPPLRLYREQIVLKYYNRLRQLPANLAVAALMRDILLQTQKLWTERLPPPIAVRGFNLMRSRQITKLDTVPYPVVSLKPPWIEIGCARLSLMAEQTNTLPGSAVQHLFREMIREKYEGCVQIYTDGAKSYSDEVNVSAAWAMGYP